MIKKFAARIGIFLSIILFSDYASAQTPTKVVAGPRLLLPVKQGLLWGYADTMRHIVITPQFDEAYNFIDRIAVVEKNKKAYAIDTNGIILTKGFDQLFQLDDTIFAVYLNEIDDTLGGWGITRLSGTEMLSMKYDEIRSLWNNVFVFRKDSLWGAINFNGVLMCEPLYDSISPLGARNILVRHAHKFGVIGTDGKEYVPAEFSRIYLPDKYVFITYNSKPSASRPRGWGAYDRRSNIEIPFGTDTIYQYGQYFLGAKDKDTLACYFPAVGGKPTPRDFKSFSLETAYFIRTFTMKGRSGIYDTLGRMIVPSIYVDIMHGGKNTWFVQDENKHWGFYNSEGSEMQTPSFDRILPFTSPITVFISKEMQGVVNLSGEIIIPAAKQTIIVRGNLIKVIKPDSTATFYETDDSGKIIGQSDYDEFRVIKISGKESSMLIPDTAAFTSGSAVASVDSLTWYVDPFSNLWGLRNIFTGESIIPPTYYYVNSIGNSLELVAMRAEITGIHIDDYVTNARETVGVVNNKTGQVVLQPKYANILPCGTEPFSGYVRAVLSDGSMALVSTDGSERTIKCTWIEQVSDGYARFCVDGKWSINDAGETVAKLSLFAVQQNLDPAMSFGIASTSEQFMDKTVCIAGGKWGYMDSTGTITVAAEYDGAKAPQKLTGAVKKNKKWGLIDMHNTSILPCEYDVLSYLQSDTTTLVIAQIAASRYGYIDKNGNITIKGDLKKSKSLGSGFIAFSRTGKWGVMRTTGETIVAETYADILPFSEGYAAVKKGGKWGFIDTTGAEIVPLKYERVGDFKEGLARVIIEHKWGFINSKNAVVVEAKFMQAGNFSGMSAPVKTKDGYGLVGKDGVYIIKPTWNKILQLDSNLRGFFVIKDQFVSGVCKSDGKIIQSPRFEQYIYLGEGRLSYRSATKVGIMDTTGRVITATIFDNVHVYSEHLAAADYDSKWGYIDLKGKFVIEPQYMIAAKFNDHSAYTYLQNGSSQFVDTTGRVVYSLGIGVVSVLGYGEGKYVLGNLDDNKQIKDEFYLTRHGVRVTRFSYKEARVFDQGLGRVRPSGLLWGLVSYSGFIVAKPKFSLIEPFEDGVARFQMLYTDGLFTLDGTPVLPVSYDAINYDARLKMIRFEKDSSVGYLHSNGTVCWPETQ